MTLRGTLRQCAAVEVPRIERVQRVYRRLEHRLVVGQLVVAPHRLAKLKDDRRRVCTASRAACRWAVADDEPVPCAEDRLEKRVTVIVSLVPVSGLVLGSREIESRPVVCPRKGVFAHANEADDAKRN